MYLCLCELRLTNKNVHIQELSTPASPTDSEGDSEYFPTPLRKKIKLPALPELPNKCSIIEIGQLDNFVQSVSTGCKRIGCRGRLVPVQAKTQRMGGAVHTVFQCTRCSRHYTFDSTILPERPTAGQNDLSKAMQVAFITAGLTHTMYKKVLDILGMAAVFFLTFQGTIQELHPIVEQMVKEMCQHGKERMKGMDQDKLFSWSKAVTCADDTWQTRGYHSKNATFTIRNYANGALLYFVHLCQRGEDNLIDEPLYQGTSKSAEGYGASKLMKKAKEEGLQISVHWQDADSTASKHVKEVYPKASIMICGGHAGKSHLKQLQLRAKQKTFPSPSEKEIQLFPDIKTVECHCKEEAKEKKKPSKTGKKSKKGGEQGEEQTTEGSEGEHKKRFRFVSCKQGCGCLTDSFCQRARNSFSNILSTSQSAAEFARRLRGLTHHVRDEHQWTEEERCKAHDLTECKKCGQKLGIEVIRRCDFHPLVECSCGKCDPGQDLNCEGKPYHTKEILNCPFHQVAYKLDCHRRIEMANQLVHPTMKRGHSNWLEASHNVLIRYRPKHLYLERLHYHVSTNLGLLQANMTIEYDHQGASYHWKTELFKRLNLPVYDGVEEVLKQQNIQRKRALEYKGTEKSQRRRVHLKKLRVQDAQQRKLWSSKHGKDTYGDTDSEKKASKGTKKVCKSCGSDKHSLPTHHLCPNNKSVTHNTLPPDANTEDEESDTSLMSGPYSDLSDEVDADMLDDNAVSGCECGASGRAHKRECPLNPRNCQEAKRGSKTLNAADPVTKSTCNEEATRLFREDKMDLDKAESEEESAFPSVQAGRPRAHSGPRKRWTTSPLSNSTGHRQTLHPTVQARHTLPAIRCQ